MYKEKSVIIIQARMGSDRFPAKMLAKIGNMPLVEYVYKRCRESGIKDIFIATSKDASDDVLYDYCKKNSIPVIRGELENVLDRYIQVARSIKAEYIIRVCGDTPFVDISLISRLLKILVDEGLDYVSLNRTTCASGFYSEAVSLKTLTATAALTSEKDDLEHVTKFIKDSKGRFLTKFLDTDLNPPFVRDIKLTIDYPEDIERANRIIEELPDKYFFTSQDILNVVERKGHIQCSQI